MVDLSSANCTEFSRNENCHCYKRFSIGHLIIHEPIGQTRKRTIQLQVSQYHKRNFRFFEIGLDIKLSNKSYMLFGTPYTIFFFSSPLYNRLKFNLRKVIFYFG